MPDANLTAAFQSIQTVLTAASSAAARTPTYKDAVLRNTGDGTIYYAIMANADETPGSGDQNTLLPGESSPVFELLDIRYTYVKAADTANNNAVEMLGTPAFA